MTTEIQQSTYPIEIKPGDTVIGHGAEAVCDFLYFFSLFVFLSPFLFIDCSENDV